MPWIKFFLLCLTAELRHGPIATVMAALDERAAASKVLNSELAKTLSLPVKSVGKSSTMSKPPTKASLKQVPSAGGNASCKVNSSSRTYRKANTNPVVKMERIPKEVASLKKVTKATVPASSSPLRDVMSNSPAPVTATMVHGTKNAVIGPSDHDKSLTNGSMLKKAMGTSRPSVTSHSAIPVTTLATQPLALTTTTTSVTYTRPTPSTVPTTTATTAFTVLSKGSKPLRMSLSSSALAATLTASSSPLRASSFATTTTTTTTTFSSKSKKSPKERKFLPCKGIHPQSFFLAQWDKPDFTFSGGFLVVEEGWKLIACHEIFRQLSEVRLFWEFESLQSYCLGGLFHAIAVSCLIG